MSKCPEGSNSRSLIRASPEKSARDLDPEETTISREWSQIDLLGIGGSGRSPAGSLSPFRGRRKKRVKPAKFTDTEKEFYQGKTEDRGNEKSISPIHPATGSGPSRGRSGYSAGRDQVDIAVLVPAEKFLRLRPRQTSPGTIEYLAMRIERLKVEPSKNILDLILIRRPFPMIGASRSINK